MSGKRGFDKGTAGVKPGIQIWRIENMEAVEQDPKDAGAFFSGDCYIVLNSKEEKGSRSWDLHFWIGKECSIDERGAVAYKAVELDDLLGGRPVQHRETEGHESALFMSLWPKGIRYQNGGIASGFNHVDPSAYQPRLLHVKGKRNVRVTQVELKTSSLNEGDVFILDLGLTLYQWNGSQANKYEKFKGLEMVTAIKDKERGGKAQIVFLESGKAGEDEGFWAALGGKAGVKAASEGGDDDEVRAATQQELFRISDASGSLEITSVAKGKLQKSMLDGNDVFLLDTGAELYVWIGKGATKDERAKGMKHAAAYLEEKGRPAWTPITRLAQTGETAAFKACFASWDEPKPRTLEEKKAGKPIARAPDVESLFKQKQEAENKMADDGTGKLEIWRIEDLKQVPLDKAEYGQFYAGDSYLLLYSYKIHGKDAWIIYFWQGRDSTSDEKAASALFAVDLDNKLGGSPVQVRVVQNKEPNHFLQLFKGRMIVHEGGHASGFKNRNDADSKDTDGVNLFHIKGTSELNTRAVQVPEVAASLNSGDCFALRTPSTVFVWAGRGANSTERATAKNIAEALKESREIVVVEEGSEPEEFWAPLGGQGEYAEFSESAEEIRQPRLFHCSSNTGNFSVEEIFNFVQDDLITDDVMILDTYAEVYVWVGRDAMRSEKDSALKLALEYVEKAPDGRSKDTPIFKVEQSQEPPTFTCHFLGWDPKKAADFADPYAKRLAELRPAGAGKAAPATEAKAAAAGPARVSASDIGFADWNSTHYTVAQLKAGGLPNIDVAKKELYLNDADFSATFKMTKDQWLAMPAWKRVDPKKKVGLF